MIYIERSRVPAPERLQSKYIQDMYALNAEHFRSRKVEKAQFSFQINTEILRHPEVLKPLNTLFHAKCAYCESHIRYQADMTVDHFRPKTTVDLEGNYFPAHYWWLAYEWRNLYLSCRQCNSAKRNLFPVAGIREELETPYEKLENELPLLLDPCMDKPGKFLVFDENGRAASEQDRGKITIEILALNRAELVEARRHSYKVLYALWEKWLQSKSSTVRDQIIRMMKPEAEYSALARQFVLQWTQRRTDLKSFWNQRDSFYSDLLADHKVITASKRQDAVKSYRKYEDELEDYSLESNVTPSNLLLIDQTIERIEIRNLRPIRDLDIQVRSTTSSSAPWTLLLGENGTGKSTILQAVALALVGSQYRTQLGINPASYVRRGCRTGHVRLHVRGFSTPFELVFRNSGPESKRLTGSDERPKIPILAYGATRLLPRPNIQPYEGKNYARVDNLFNPFVPLADATKWLMGLQDTQFHHVARTLRDLLNLEPDVILRRNRQKKCVELPSLHVSSLTELSDGYQSMLALVVDIMMVMTRHFEAMETAKGIVLLDEIGAHLHPRWRMRVVKSLRMAFPNIQFLATTHDPLCLRGIDDGEVAVLKKSAEGDVYAVTDLPPVTGMRVEQLLTSEHFGLSSTVDPDMEEAFERYYKLLRQARLDIAEKKELEELRQYLERYRVLGSTRRERLMLEAIDRHLAISATGTTRNEKSALDIDLADIIKQVKL